MTANYDIHVHITEYNRSSEKLFKVIIIGDPGVGKTSFIRRYVQNAYRPDYKATIGVDFALKIVRWADNQTIKLQLWDIAGKPWFWFFFIEFENYDVFNEYPDSHQQDCWRCRIPA